MATSRPKRIVVSGLGMVSSVGRNVVTSCASARAGLTRLQQLDGPLLTDPDTGELEKASGHTVSGVTDGFWKLGRLLRLGVAALKDLQTSSGLEDWTDTDIFLTLPSGYYQKEHEAAARVEMEEEQIQGADAPYEAELRNEFYSKRLFTPMLKLAGLSIPPSKQRHLFGDQAGFIPVLRAAIDGLHQGRCERCIVGGIDSYVESDLVEALYDFGLLKTPSRATGFFPGESAAFVLLEREETVRRRRGRGTALLEAPRAAAESFHRLSGQRALGSALSDAISETLAALDDGGQHTGLVIGNLNGDPYRAYDWGGALVRLRTKNPWTDVPAWSPVLPFGEIGAATGAAAICMATRGFERGYAGTDNVLVWLCSDSGARGAFYIRKYLN